MLFRSELDDPDRSVDSGAKAARRRDQQGEGRAIGHAGFTGAALYTIACLHQTLTALGHVTRVFEDFALRPTMSKAAVAAVLSLVLVGCAREGDIQQTGILTSYTACPPVAVVSPAGDVTTFDPADSRDARAIDVVAHITNLRSTCSEAGEQIVTQATFEVQARRSDNRGARDVVLPYFATVVQGNTNVVAKRVRQVNRHFADGQYRAVATGAASSRVMRSAATLPEDIRGQITRDRRAGDPNAAIDPMADPAVRAAVDRARFELMVGFELTPEQLRYNATR